MARSTGMVRAQEPKRRLCASKEGEAGPDPSQGRKTDSLEILPAQVVACPHGRVPGELRQPAGRPLRWCDPDNNCGTQQTRDHLFKHCSRWKDQQAQLWARVKEVTKRGKPKWRVGDLLADERCSPAVLDFLQSTYVGRAAPPVPNRPPPGSAIPVQTRMTLPGEKFALGADSCQWAHKMRPGEESETGGLGRSRRKQALATPRTRSGQQHLV